MTRERTTGTRKSTAADEAHPGKGVAGLAVAWKVAVFLPLVLTGAVLAGRIDFGSDDPGPAPSANSVVVDTGTPDAFEDRNLNRFDGKGDKAKRDKASKSPTADATSAPPTLVPPSSSPTADDPDPSTSSPTKSPSKTPSPSPTDTPTPEEARKACQEAGVNPLDLEAMAECIADMLGG